MLDLLSRKRSRKSQVSKSLNGDPLASKAATISDFWGDTAVPSRPTDYPATDQSSLARAGHHTPAIKPAGIPRAARRGSIIRREARMRRRKSDEVPFFLTHPTIHARRFSAGTSNTSGDPSLRPKTSAHDHGHLPGDTGSEGLSPSASQRETASPGLIAQEHPSSRYTSKQKTTPTATHTGEGLSATDTSVEDERSPGCLLPTVETMGEAGKGDERKLVAQQKMVRSKGRSKAQPGQGSREGMTRGHTRDLNMRRASLQRDSKLGRKEMEALSVQAIQDAVNNLGVKPLGKDDDPSGVIYVDGDLHKKTVDVRVLEEIGESVQEVRKDLLDLRVRRRSLVEEARSHNKRVSSGFPRSPFVEQMHRSAAKAVETSRRNAEKRLKKLIKHRRKLWGVLTAAQGDGIEHTPITSALGTWERESKAEASTSGGRRRSSFTELQALTKHLMVQGVVGVDKERAQEEEVSQNKLETSLAKVEKRVLDRGFRNVFEAVFPEEKEKRVRPTRCGKGSTKVGWMDSVKDERGQQEVDVMAFLAASTPAEHLEFLGMAMDPSRARDFPTVVKCLIIHYTGEAADELDLLLGGRGAMSKVQAILQMTLLTLSEIHATYLPSTMLLLWLISRGPSHMRALLIKGGVLRIMFQRMKSVEAFPEKDRAMQYAALSLLTGTLFA